MLVQKLKKEAVTFFFFSFVTLANLKKKYCFRLTNILNIVKTVFKTSFRGDIMVHDAVMCMTRKILSQMQM